MCSFHTRLVHIIIFITKLQWTRYDIWVVVLFLPVAFGGLKSLTRKVRSENRFHRPTAHLKNRHQCYSKLFCVNITLNFLFLVFSSYFFSNRTRRQYTRHMYTQILLFKVTIGREERRRAANCRIPDTCERLCSRTQTGPRPSTICWSCNSARWSLTTRSSRCPRHHVSTRLYSECYRTTTCLRCRVA